MQKLGNMRRGSLGYTLIELMMAAAVLGIVSAIAVPTYMDYIKTANEGVMISNIETIRLFEESLKLNDGTYAAGTYNPAAPNDPAGLKTVLGWEPRTEDDSITYVVDNVTASSFRITASNTEGESVVRTFP